VPGFGLCISPTLYFWGRCRGEGNIPVNVLKHCSLKFSVSKTSIPEGGSGLSPVELLLEPVLCSGCNLVVMAWTLFSTFC